MALSRVRNIQGLHLLDFDKRDVIVDVAALHEYNRLRKTINMPPFAIPQVVRKRNDMPRTKAVPTPTSAVVTLRKKKSLPDGSQAQSR